MGTYHSIFSLFIHFHIAINIFRQVHTILGLIAIANSAWVWGASTERSLPCMQKTLIHMRAESKSLSYTPACL